LFSLKKIKINVHVPVHIHKMTRHTITISWNWRGFFSYGPFDFLSNYKHIKIKI